MLFTMKKVCTETGMKYEALKYYCNEGLVPNVKRDKNNRRVFDEKDIAWIKDLTCLKKCRMSIDEMKWYLARCMEGKKNIPVRQKFLEEKRKMLQEEIEELKTSIAYIDWKQNFYKDVTSGKIPYRSNLIKSK